MEFQTDSDRIRFYLLIFAIGLFMGMGFYVIKNIEHIKSDPCDVCERGTGFKCQNFQGSPVYHRNGSLYKPLSQPGFSQLGDSNEANSNIEKICKDYEKQKKLNSEFDFDKLKNLTG